jgi:endo-1,4-beta-xylanase
LRLLERLVGRGVPIQALGYEAHMNTEVNLSEAKWRLFLDEVTAMGLKIMITEMDIYDARTLGDIPKRDAAVASLATQFLDITLSYPDCLGLLTWGQVDRYTWLRKESEAKRWRTDGAPLRPCPRDEDFKPKPLYHAIANAIDRAEPRVSA